MEVQRRQRIDASTSGADVVREIFPSANIRPPRQPSPLRLNRTEYELVSPISSPLASPDVVEEQVEEIWVSSDEEEEMVEDPFDHEDSFS